MPSSRAAAKAVGARALPQVNAVLEREEVRQAAALHGRALITTLVRERLDGLRREARAGRLDGTALEAGVAALPAWVDREARSRTASSMRPVINATGVILHTNLGRAALPAAAVRRMAEVARAYTTLEYDLARGGRGSRSSHLDRVFTLLFPGRAFHVVNNNAAAVLLALNTFAEGKEVIVSRGELVEIGGSFRIPDVMRKGGAILKEIGTTNKTRLADYERAIGPRTGLILKVHPSNYRIVGFTAQAALKEVAALGRRRKVPVVMDQGSGNLLDLARLGIRNEPSVFDALRDGADLVCFSGDKMLGGPQAGLIVGRRDLVKPMRENSLSRALRVDKMTYAALEAVLLEYARGTAETGLPVVRMVTMTSQEIEARARRLVDAVAARAGDSLTLAVVPGLSVPGGGSAPEEGLPTALAAVSSRRLSARAIEERLRGFTTPVIARIEGGKVLLDLRTVLEEQEGAVVEALAGLAIGG
ncbi:MAG: L-seryl-tRNA(Sec) selenium transferase [Acidobacteriota bacterium]